jgi:hypothetical protein
MFYQNLYHRKLFLGKLFSQELILAHTSTLKQQSAARHVAPLGHIILIPSKPVFTQLYYTSSTDVKFVPVNYPVK